MKHAGILTGVLVTVIAMGVTLVPAPAHAQAQPAPIPDAQPPNTVPAPPEGADATNWPFGTGGAPIMVMPYDEKQPPPQNWAQAGRPWYWSLVSGSDGKKYWIAAQASNNSYQTMASTVSQPDPWSPACSGVECLTADQQKELNTLCGKVGEAWDDYALCREMNVIISRGSPP